MSDTLAMKRFFSILTLSLWLPAAYGSACLSLDDPRASSVSLLNCLNELKTKIKKIMAADEECRFSESYRISSLQSLKKKREPEDRLYRCNDVYKQSMLCEFNRKEQEFLAATFTIFGEARGTPLPYLPEFHAIRRVMENRKRILNQREEHQNKLTLLHVALQDLQFSMYNANDPNWLILLDSSAAQNKSLLKSIESYKKYPSVTCLPEETCEGIINYHANWMDQLDVRWAMDPQGTLLPPASFRIDGYQISDSVNKEPLRHRFYHEKTPGLDSENFYYYTVYHCEQNL